MSKNTRIIGLSGTNGAGKDTVGLILSERYNYLFVSVSDMLREECRRRNLPVVRENLRMISAEWRRAYGLGVLVDKAIELYEAAPEAYAGVVACPLRNLGEADHLKSLGGIVVWVDADPRIRYDRIQANAHHRGRAGEDAKTFEEFLAEEQAEMQQSGDEATLNMGAVKERADVTVQNNTTDMDILAADVEQALKLDK